MSERPNDTPDTEAGAAPEPDGPMPDPEAPMAAEPEAAPEVEAAGPEAAPEVEAAGPEAAGPEAEPESVVEPESAPVADPEPEPEPEPEVETAAAVDADEGVIETDDDAMELDADDDLETDLEPELEPAAPIRPMTPAERRAARSGLSHGQIPTDPSLRIKDRTSAIFVLLTVGVFLAIFLNALVLGHGGFLTPLATPTPVPSITAAPSATPAPSVTVAPTPTAAPTSTPTPS